MPTFPLFLSMQPGIQRDTTAFDTPCCIDGQGTRFYNGRPRKMGGYMFICMDQTNSEPIRNLFSVPKSDGTVDVYMGYGSALKVVNIYPNGQPNGSVFYDRTPDAPSEDGAGGFIPDANNEWKFDLFTYDSDPDNPSVEPISYIVAQVSPTLENVSSTKEGNIFYGPVNFTPGGGDEKLVFIPGNPITTPDPGMRSSGGVVTISPFVFSYGTDGGVVWSDRAENPVVTGNWTNSEPITGLKIVYGTRIRSSGGPAGAFISLGSFLIGTHAPVIGDDNNFNFETIDENISILSASSVIQYNNMLFWPGQQQFYIYNGVVKELPNNMNANYFFDNINMKYASKVWGVFVQRYKELWWFYPRGDATECTHAVIYKIDEQTWYDTALARSAGDPALFLAHPLMADSNLMPNVSSPGRPLWLHEYGWDYVYGTINLAIDSYFETNILNMAAGGSGDTSTRIRCIEPDFIQNGSMDVSILQRAYPKSEPVESQPYTFAPETEKVDVNQQGRFFSLKFRSNVAGGHFQMGKTIVDVDAGDPRPTSGLVK